MKTIWASSHKPTQVQIDQLGGSVEFLPTDLQNRINNCPDNQQDLGKLCADLYDYLRDIRHCTVVQLGGSPAFQSMFFISAAQYLPATVRFAFAHSERVSEEVVQPDGSTIKTSKFAHRKFIYIR